VAEDDARPPVRAEGAARSTLLAFLTQMATAAFTAVLTIYLVRALGPQEFGLFSLAASIGALLMLPSDFGISGSTARFVAERFGNPRAIAELMSDALRLKLIVGGAVSLALLVASGPIADAYGEPTLTWPIRWMAIAVMFQSLVAFYRYAFLAMRDASVGLRIVIGEAAVETSASILLVVIAGGAASASAGRAIGYAFGAALAVGLTLKQLGPVAFARSSRLREARRRLARYAGALFTIDLAFSASVQISPLMIGGFLGAREVGLFQAPSRLIVLLQYPGVALANGISPRMARSEDHEPEVELFTKAMRYLLLVQALTVVPVVIWAEPIVDLVLGPDYARSSEILQLLGPYVFASGLAGPLSGAVNYLGEARRRVPIAVGDFVVSGILTAVLLATIGLNGAVWTADVVSVLYVAVHVWLLRKLVDLPLRPLLITAARGLLAAAAMGAVLFAFGTEELAVWEWIAGGLGGLAAFLVVIIATREVSVAELRALPRTILARGN
jgi:O-antigen/teichoic acid export membrane protein